MEQLGVLPLVVYLIDAAPVAASETREGEVYDPAMGVNCGADGMSVNTVPLSELFPFVTIVLPELLSEVVDVLFAELSCDIDVGSVGVMGVD